MRLLFIAQLFALLAVSQTNYTPARYMYNGKEFLVFPSRSDNVSDIPASQQVLPDGDYILFADYTYKDRSSIADSSTVSAIFSLLNNKPNGRCTFFIYEYKNDKKRRSEPFAIISGAYEQGLKSGKWITRFIYGVREEIYYQNGLRHGYNVEYDEKDQVVRVQKFCSDKMCDTVIYYYRNGKVRIIYDVISEPTGTFSKEEKSFTSWFLSSDPKTNLWGDVLIKSFYRDFHADGKLKNNVTFTNGKDPVFDTLFLSAGEKLTVHEENKNQHVARFWTDGLTRLREQYYSGQNKVADFQIHFRNKTADTISIVDFRLALNYDSLQNKSVMTGYTREQKKTTYFYSLPALHYAWQETSQNNSFRPVGLSGDTILIRDTFRYEPQALQRIREIKLIAKNDNSFYFPEFINLPGLSLKKIKPYFSEQIHYEAPAALPDFLKGRYKTFGSVDIEYTYLENGLPANGEIILTSNNKARRKSKTPIRYTSKIRPSVWKMHFENGKRIGQHEMLEGVNTTKTEDLYAEFTSNEQGGKRFTKAQYLHGELNGTLSVFVGQTYNLGEYSKDSSRVKFTQKTFVWKQREENTKAGKLHGSVKHFDEKGRLRTHYEFSNDSLLSALELNEHGDSVGIFKCSNGKPAGYYFWFTGDEKTEAWFGQENLPDSLRIWEGQRLKTKVMLKEGKLLKLMFDEKQQIKETIQSELRTVDEWWLTFSCHMHNSFPNTEIKYHPIKKSPARFSDG